MTVDGFRITLRPVLVKLIRYEKYNGFGEPIYGTQIQGITNIDKITTTG